MSKSNSNDHNITLQVGQFHLTTIFQKVDHLTPIFFFFIFAVKTIGFLHFSRIGRILGRWLEDGWKMELTNMEVDFELLEDFLVPVGQQI